MKINFKVAKQKDIYEVGDVFRSKNYLYLVVNDTNDGYALICLSENVIIRRYNTLEELVEDVKDYSDGLVHAEINVF